MDGFSDKELEVFIKGLFAVAWADRVIQPEERELLESFLRSFEMPPELQRQAQAWFDAPVPVDSVRWPELPIDGRVFVYSSAVRMARADGIVFPDERSALRQIGQALGLPAEVTSAIENDAPVDLATLEL